MNPRIEETWSLAASLENELLLRAHDQIAAARLINDEDARDKLFAVANDLRRVAEFAGAIIRNMDAEREVQRVPSTREILHAAKVRGRPLLRLVGGGV